MLATVGRSCTEDHTRRRLFRRGLAPGAAAWLAACASPTAPAEPAKMGAQPRELTYMPWDQNRADLVPVREEVLRGFTAKYPHLTVTPVSAGGNFLEKLKAVVAAGTPPDVADTHHGRVRDLGAAGTVQDLSRLLKRDPYPRDHVGWEPYQWMGKQFGVPWGLQATCVYYNKALFDQAGVPVPADDWTWERFVDLARRLTRPEGDAGQSIWGAADDGGRDYGYMHALLATFGGGIFTPDFTAVTLTSPSSVQGMEFRASWAGRLGIQPPAGATGGLQDLFQQGKLAMHSLGSWFVSNIKAGALGKEGTWDVAPMPKGPRRRAGLAHENGIGVPAGVPLEEQSWALLKHLTAAEGLVPFARAGRIIPANKKVWDAALPPDGRPQRFKTAVLDTWEEIATTSPWTPRRAEVSQVWNEELDAVWKGERPAREGAMAFKLRTEALLQEFRGQGIL